jgi:hypothetical protein
MDDLGLNVNKIPGDDKIDKPIPFDDGLDKPIPFDDGETSKASVSHAPLSLGGAGTAGAPKIEVPKRPEKKAAEKIVSSERIAGVKTFFTKLHPGAMEFLDEQINNWLKDNPSLVIKRTNTTTGMVQAKKTEPNIIIHIWY